MPDEPLLPALYLTARVAAALFLVAFVTRRRGWTLAFVAAHAVHLGVIAADFAGPARERFIAGWPLLLGAGGAVYGLVAALGWRAWARAAPSRFDSAAWLVAWAAFARPLAVRAVTLRAPVHVGFTLAFAAALAIVGAREWRSLRARAVAGGSAGAAST